MIKYIVLFFTFMLSSYSYSEQPNFKTKNEINHLITFIKTSACSFKRNGTWYKSTDAAEHISKKYEYVMNKGLINKAEDFIEYSATKSSISGKQYMIKCGQNPELTSAEWLKKELSIFRNKLIKNK